MKLDSSKRPETHVHCAVFLVQGGDPFGVTKEARAHKEKEVCEFAVRWEPHVYGQLPAEYVIKAFAELTDKCLSKMREAGVLRSGD